MIFGLEVVCIASIAKVFQFTAFASDRIVIPVVQRSATSWWSVPFVRWLDASERCKFCSFLTHRFHIRFKTTTCACRKQFFTNRQFYKNLIFIRSWKYEPIFEAIHFDIQTSNVWPELLLFTKNFYRQFSLLFSILFTCFLVTLLHNTLFFQHSLSNNLLMDSKSWWDYWWCSHFCHKCSRRLRHRSLHKWRPNHRNIAELDSRSET